MLSSSLPTLPTTDPRFCITPDSLSLERVYALADTPANGAIVVMSGMVRDNTAGRPVLYLDYQAYEPMALRVFADIAQQVRDRWPNTTQVVIHHRTGRLYIGDISVLIAVGCPHRTEAFAACQYAIDTLKQTAPIWKKEWYNEQEFSWVKCC